MELGTLNIGKSYRSMDTFHCFPRLPFELRARVWEMTVEPRTVDVRIKERGREPRILVSSTPIPGTVHACHEARNLKLYQQLFSEIPEDSTERRYIWANLDIDLISIGPTLFFQNYEPVASTIQRLKFEGEYGDEVFCRYSMHHLRIFVNVKEIHVICADGMWSWWGALEEHYWPCGNENVFMIDPKDGRMMRGIEMDQMIYEEVKERAAREGYDYDTGAALG